MSRLTERPFSDAPARPRGDSWDYAVHFVSWTIAYLPAFAALLLSRK